MIRHHQSVSVCAAARRSKTRNTKKTTTKEKMNFGLSSYIKCVKETEIERERTYDFWEMWRDQQLPNVPYQFSSSSLNFPFVFYFRIYQEILDQHRDRAGKCLERQLFLFSFPPFLSDSDVFHLNKRCCTYTQEEATQRGHDKTPLPSLLIAHTEPHDG